MIYINSQKENLKLYILIFHWLRQKILNETALQVGYRNNASYVDFCLSHGITYDVTHDSYGMSEELLSMIVLESDHG